jgi:branched-chain amino acid transport system substrate-binding protein
MTRGSSFKRTGLFIAGIWSFALLSGCTAWRSPADERPIRAARARGEVAIAVAWPWELRKEVRYGEGLEMAADEANAAGGVNGRPLRLVRFDDGGSVDEGRLVAQRIAADPDIVAVIGHLQSYVTVPAAAIYDLSGLVLIAPTSTDPELTSHGYKRVFRTTFTDKAIGRQLAQFASQRRFRRVAIYYIRNTYGRELANAFEERANEIGVTVVGRRSYDPSDEVTPRTFDPIVSQWKTLEMDAIFLAGEVPSAALFIATAREAGLKVPILGGDAMSSPALMNVSGRAAEGTIVGSFFHPDEPRAEVRGFAEAFRKRYGVPPDAGSAVGYDAVRLLVHAMQQAHSSVPDEVATALHKVRDWPGVTGAFTFDNDGDVVGKQLVKLLVRNGRFEYLSDSPKAMATIASR